MAYGKKGVLHVEWRTCGTGGGGMPAAGRESVSLAAKCAASLTAFASLAVAEAAAAAIAWEVSTMICRDRERNDWV